MYGSTEIDDVASDASGIGFFSYDVNTKKRLAGRALTEEEKDESSTYRELLAFNETWTDEKNLIEYKNKRVSHKTDNKALVYILVQGSRNRKLQPLVVEAILKLREYGIKVDPVWVSRDDGMIKYADLGSRDFHADDISIDFHTFLLAKKEFGDFSVDGFATANNTRCDTFFSRRDSPGTSGVDFFLQVLEPSELYWLFPPVSLLCQTIEHLALYKAKGVVLVPVWPKSSFFTYFFPDGKHLARWAEKCLWVKPYFVAGPMVTSRGLKGRKKFQSVLIFANFCNFDMSEFYEPFLNANWCRKGGCYDCNI